MRYALILITHGDAPHLEAVVEAFAEHVTPAPAVRFAVQDGHGAAPPVEPLGPWAVERAPAQRGFCWATQTGWRQASRLDVDHVFWLENDFLICRPVDLSDLAAVLDDEPFLAQMQLMRNAVNEAERAAGGLFESRPGEYLERSAFRPGARDPFRWLEHRSYATTNPSLMRRQFMVDNPWPDYPSECEGRFGIDLVQHGYRFGVWGAGEPWVEHVGQRDGTGLGY